MKITHFDRCAEQELRREYKIATFPQVHLKSMINTIQIFFQSYREHLCIIMESSSKAKVPAWPLYRYGHKILRSVVEETRLRGQFFLFHINSSCIICFHCNKSRVYSFAQKQLTTFEVFKLSSTHFFLET